MPVARDAGGAARVNDDEMKRSLEFAALDEVGDHIGEALLVVLVHAGTMREVRGPTRQTTTSCDDVSWFRDELRHRDRLIAELRQEQDEANDLMRRFREHAEDYDATLESRRETFDMELTDEGKWTWKPFLGQLGEAVEQYRSGETLESGGANSQRQSAGSRPSLAASEAQIAAVRRLHKQGKSLRWIVDDTNLSLRTVRTIIGREHGTDRTTKTRREKIEIDKFQRAHWKAQKRTGDALPK